MAQSSTVWLAMGVIFGGVFLLVGVALLYMGLYNVRMALRALRGSETSVGNVDADADAANVKLSATVRGVPEPVTTLDGEDVALYRIRAVLKNQWNRLKKRRNVEQLVADATELDAVVLKDDAGQACLLTATEDSSGNTWGDVQSANRNEFMQVRRDFVSGDWSNVRTYTDAGVPPNVESALQRQYDADTDFDVSSLGVGLSVKEDVVRAGETLRIAGRVEPSQVTSGEVGTRTVADGGSPRSEQTDGTSGLATDGGRSALALNLTPHATVTTGSWRTLAWDSLKRALLRVPFGVLLILAAVAIVWQTFGRAGVL